jgi:hypothetical protein
VRCFVALSMIFEVTATAVAAAAAAVDHLG